MENSNNDQNKIAKILQAKLYNFFPKVLGITNKRKTSYISLFLSLL